MMIAKCFPKYFWIQWIINMCAHLKTTAQIHWVSIPDHQHKIVSYKVEKEPTGQIKLNIQTHLTVGQSALSRFAWQFSASSSELCSRSGPPPLFPQCTCILSDSRLPAGGLAGSRN
ncbi:uncharacterized protein AKAME5_000217500 [Lates japonicus]|uniref:Uncharacterized protein n=1 Tax=Lates japonicus TaxID=270547 RepID=A0AAD3QXA3_LATJO|nr:uncharacterized protein AKAME5_000217500 [Lates japonicus]